MACWSSASEAPVSRRADPATIRRRTRVSGSSKAAIRWAPTTERDSRRSTTRIQDAGPRLKLNKTNKRTDILIHPASGFKSTIGCINLSRTLANAQADIDGTDSRKRVIAVIEDLKNFLAKDFPKNDDKPIPRAFAVIDGEPKL